MTNRERAVTVRMSDVEIEKMRELAEHAGLSISDTIRQLIRKAHDEIGAKPKPKPKRK